MDVVEKTKSFPNHEWKAAEIPTLSFEVIDTASKYNLYLVLRHEDAYRYKNIWVTVQMKSPDTTIVIKREFTLANNTKWLGTNMSDIIEHRIAFNTIPATLKKGTYTFTLQQSMREEPLQFILNAGIRVQKVQP